MLFLDLDELENVFSRCWLWSTKSPAFARFRAEDHLIEYGDVPDLRKRAIEVLRDRGFTKAVGPVRLLTQLRYLGFAMNPVSFFYCYDPTGKAIEYVIAEVNNTPWGEQHLYIVPATETRRRSGIAIDEIEKIFHVSPFMPMEMYYRMAFSAPGSKLGVKIENHSSARDDAGSDPRLNAKKVLDVTMLLNRKPLTARNLNWMLLKFPLVTFKIFAGIYWQAFRLYLKKVPFHSHPGKQGRDMDPPSSPTERDSKQNVKNDSETVLVSR